MGTHLPRRRGANEQLALVEREQRERGVAVVIEQGQQVGGGHGVEVGSAREAALVVGRLADDAVVTHPAEVERDGGAMAYCRAVACECVLKGTAGCIVTLSGRAVDTHDGRQQDEEVKIERQELVQVPARIHFGSNGARPLRMRHVPDVGTVNNNSILTAAASMES